ncbi:hypothetical protein SBY92_001422 [Candida maltosa Xu316]
MNGLAATSLGFQPTNRYFNGLKSSKEEYTTWDLFIVHILRVTLNFTIFTYMRLLDVHSLIVHVWELAQIISFDLKVKFSDHRRDPTKHYFQSIIDECIFYWEAMASFPLIIWKVFNPMKGTPVGLNKCLEYIPKLNTPESVTLILQCNPPMLSSPPDIPQPYLDADRNIIVPDKKEIQYVIAIRNEYFTQCKSHIAAERVRLLREIGRFITWCCLVPTIKEITIYEKSGNCWDGGGDFIDSIKNSILVELVALANTCEPKELRQFKKILPQIVLLDKFTKISYIVNDGEAELQNTTHQDMVTVDDIISVYEDQKKLIVNLCDHRVRTVNYVSLTGKIVQDNMEPDDPQFNEEFPPSSEFIIAPANNGHYVSKLCGYAPIDPDVNQRIISVIYFSHIKFGYPFFSRSLYHYALEFPFKPNIVTPEEGSADTAPSSQQMVNVFKRLNSGTTKHSGFSGRVSRIASPRSMIAKSFG